MNIKRARVDDHVALTNVMRKSKAIWGYSKEQMKLWEGELTITEKDILENNFFNIYHDNQIAGFYSESIQFGNLKLENLFVHPDFVGQGYGKLLLEDFLKRSNSIQHERLILEADPNAELFYIKHNFKTIALQKTSIKDRYMPIMVWSNPEIKNSTLFDSERLYVRHLDVNDLEEFHKIMDYEESKIELNRFISYYRNSKMMFRIWALIEKKTDNFVGICGVYINKNNEQEIAYRLQESNWRKGYGTESAKALIEFCFATLEFEKLFAYARNGNIGSRKILSKLMTYNKRIESYEHTNVVDHEYSITRKNWL